MNFIKNAIIKDKPTNGFGVLEKYLSNKRAQISNKLIDDKLRNGKVLDIGCGSFPCFLTSTKFREKYGVDKYINKKAFHSKHINLKEMDIENERIPFKDGFFDVVVMLAVFEHIKPENLDSVLAEVNRVLKKGGVFIITTPSPWSVPVLHILSRIGIISKVEIDDHKSAFHSESIIDFMAKAKFEKDKIRFGYFEFYLNIWFMAKK